MVFKKYETGPSNAKWSVDQKEWLLTFDRNLVARQMASLMATIEEKLNGRQSALSAFVPYDDTGGVFRLTWRRESASYDCAVHWCGHLVKSVKVKLPNWEVGPLPSAVPPSGSGAPPVPIDLDTDIVGPVRVAPDPQLSTIPEHGGASAAALTTPDFGVSHVSGTAVGAPPAGSTKRGRGSSGAVAGVAPAVSASSSMAAAASGPMAPESATTSVGVGPSVGVPPAPSKMQWIMQKALKLHAGFALQEEGILRGFKKPRNHLADTLHSTTYMWRPAGCSAFVVKVFKDKAETEFLQEVDMLSKLWHPNIVEMHDVAQCLDHCSLLTKFGGETLSWFIRREVGSTTYLVDSFGSLVQQLLSALKYIHDQGVIHRDVKPGNIVIDSDGVLRLIDFGMAGINMMSHRTKHMHVSEKGFMYCTLPYRAIELLLGCDQYTTAVDIWSTGCVLFEVITKNRLITAHSNVAFQTAQECCSQLLYSGNRSGGLHSMPGYRPSLIPTLPSAANFHVRMGQHPPLGVSCSNFIFSMLQLTPDERATAAGLEGHWERMKYSPLVA